MQGKIFKSDVIFELSDISAIVLSMTLFFLLFGSCFIKDSKAVLHHFDNEMEQEMLAAWHVYQ